MSGVKKAKSGPIAGAIVTPAVSFPPIMISGIKTLDLSGYALK